MAQDNVKTDEVTYGDFKGNPIITLPIGQRGFTFGISKAKAIIKYFDEIKDFVDKHSENKNSS